MFVQLSSTRTYHSAGPNALQPSEIVAFCQLMRTPLGAEHVAILLAMDAVWMAAFYGRGSAEMTGNKPAPVVSPRPISAALFDAMVG